MLKDSLASIFAVLSLTGLFGQSGLTLGSRKYKTLSNERAEEMLAMGVIRCPARSRLRG
jgi:hypothetical protein